MGRGLLLWLIGIPLPIILLICVPPKSPSSVTGPKQNADRRGKSASLIDAVQVQLFRHHGGRSKSGFGASTLYLCAVERMAA